MTASDPSSPLAPARSVSSWPCQSVCVWRPTGDTWHAQEHEDLRVFACSACGSEWVRTESWTPIDAQGQVPEAVLAEREGTDRRPKGP